MADDFDVEAMLEESYKQKNEEEPVSKSTSSSSSKRRSSREKESDRDKDKRRRSRSKDRDRERKRSSDRDRDRDRHKDRRSDRDKDRDRNRDNKRSSRHKDDKRDRDRDRSKDRDRDRRRDRDSDRDRDTSSRRDRESSRHRRHSRSKTVSPVRPAEPDLTPEERDARTVFCMQLAARIRPRDLEEFFSAVGKVKDVRLITDNKSHRSKGISYVEFQEIDSVALAIGLSGQRLLGVPIIIQPSHAERNRMASAQAAALKAANSGPMRLYVGSLHYNITEEMLRGIFEPFGRIEDLKLMKDNTENRSAGFGFITYSNAEDAKKAMDQMNGFELAGRAMKVTNMTDRSTDERFDADEIDRAGFGLGATGRLHLMAKLAEGTGMQIPQAAANVLGSSSYNPPPVAQTIAAPPISTPCFMLSNMFDPAKETSPTWEIEVRDDVIAECNKHGGVVHIYVDRASATGNVYVKCPTIATAVASVNSLHGRYFAGKVITAAYVPVQNYTGLFPDTNNSLPLVMPSGAARGQMYA